jgi:hypothetical protein
MIYKTVGGGGITSLRTGQSSSNFPFTFWAGSYPQDQYMHVLITSNGTNNIPQDDTIMYINGKKSRSDQNTIGGSATSGPIRPVNDMYYHGFWTSVFGDANRQPARTERIQVFDKELTALEAQELYYNINSARGGSPTVPNLFRDWDFSAHAAGVVPELTGSGFDMAIVTGGAQPGNPDFY